MSFHNGRIKRIPSPLPYDFDPMPIVREAGHLPVQDINANFTNVERAIDETQDRLLLIQRDDGGIRSQLVCWPQLCDEVQIAIRTAGKLPWNQTSDFFVGNGSRRNFQLSPGGPAGNIDDGATPADQLYLVMIDGVEQEPGRDYIVQPNGNLVFTNPPPAGMRIVVRSWAFTVIPVQGGFDILQDQIDDIVNGVTDLRNARVTSSTGKIGRAHV